MTGPPGEISGRGLVLCAEPAARSAVGQVYGRYLVASCRRFLALAPELPPELRAAHGRLAALVGQALGRDRRSMLSCFASPVVGTPLQCVELRADLPQFRARIDSGVAAMLPNLLLEMALRGLIPQGQSFVWEHGAPPLASLTIGGELTAPAGATGLRFSASHVAALGGAVELVRLPLQRALLQAALAEGGGGFRFARCFRRIGGVTSFATADHNPIAAFEAHPEKAGNPVDLGGHGADDWVETLEQAFALVERHLPGEFGEMGVMLHEVIPVGFDAERHLSASYREAVGTVYLTLHPNLMTMTEAVIHEFQHNKLNVAAHGAEFIGNAFQPLYRSPIRPDPRPLWGILLAVHAFLPVAELYRRMRDAGDPLAAPAFFAQRLSDIDLKNHEGMEMLRAHAEFTAAGRALFDDLEELEGRHLAERAARGLGNTPTEIHLA